MPNEMIEKVAKAIHAKAYETRDDCLSPDWIEVAKAAIAAMREPTKEMIAEGEKELFEHLPDARDWTLTHTKESYEAMIDAALKE